MNYLNRLMIVLVSSMAFQMTAQIDTKMQTAVCLSQIDILKGLMPKQQLTIDEKDKLLLIAEEVIQLRKAKLQPDAKSLSALKKYAKMEFVDGLAILDTGFLAGVSLVSNTKVKSVTNKNPNTMRHHLINKIVRLKIDSSF